MSIDTLAHDAWQMETVCRANDECDTQGLRPMSTTNEPPTIEAVDWYALQAKRNGCTGVLDSMRDVPRFCNVQGAYMQIYLPGG